MVADLCSGECTVRVDLLLIYALLLVMTVWSIVVAVRSRRIANGLRGGVAP